MYLECTCAILFQQVEFLSTNGLTFGGGCLMNIVMTHLFMCLEILKKQVLKQLGTIFFLFLLLHYTGLNISITFSIFSFSVLSLYFVECPWPVHMIKRCLVSDLCCLLCSPENHSCLVLFCKRFRRSRWIILCSVCNCRLQPPFVSYLFNILLLKSSYQQHWNCLLKPLWF